MLWRLAILASIIFCTPSMGQESQANYTVVDSRFIVTVPTPDGSVMVLSSTIVPLRLGVCYGWALRLKPANGLVKFREVFVLPGPAPNVSAADDPYSPVHINADRTEIEVIRYAVPDKGWIESGWCVAPDDPEGHHEMSIYINDTLMHEFQFEAQR